MIDLQYDRGREQEGERYLWDARAGVQKPVNSRVRVRALGLRWHVSGYATVVSDQVAAVHARPFKYGKHLWAGGRLGEGSPRQPGPAADCALRLGVSRKLAVAVDAGRMWTRAAVEGVRRARAVCPW